MLLCITEMLLSGEQTMLWVFAYKIDWVLSKYNATAIATRYNHKPSKPDVVITLKVLLTYQGISKQLKHHTQCLITTICSK